MNGAEQGLIKRNGSNSGSEGTKNGRLFVAEEHIVDLRKERIEWWRNAPEDVEDYLKGSVDASNGNYAYPEGKILLIGDKKKKEALQVMSTCETPWAFTTVDKAFAEFPQDLGPIKVLERGFGMGLTARRVMHHLITRGGEYTVIELNKGNADYAREWIKKFKSGLTNMAGGLPGTKPDINITLIEGEAYEETAILEKEEKKYHILISDTYPQNETEQGTNDLQDLEISKHCLEPEKPGKPGGVFTFFAYFPGSGDGSGVASFQRDTIAKHFNNYGVSHVEVNPPPDYKYLWTPDGLPIRKLPVVICKNPTI